MQLVHGGDRGSDMPDLASEEGNARQGQAADWQQRLLPVALDPWVASCDCSCSINCLRENWCLVMNRKPHFIRQGATATLSGFALSAAAAAAIIAIEPVVAVSFREPDRKPPRGTLGGGSRTGATIIASLVPYSGYGLTNQARPTFMVYLAPGAVAGREAIFYLQEAGEAARFQATISLPERPGVIAFELPEVLQDLEIERPYHWFLVLKNAGDCRMSARTPFARGTIERMAAPAASEALPLSLEAAIAASQEGRWYDAAAMLAALRQAQPEDLELSKHWQEFLQSAQLGDFAAFPPTRVSAQPQ